MNRRAFFAALAGMVAAPFVPWIFVAREMSHEDFHALYAMPSNATPETMLVLASDGFYENAGNGWQRVF
jgi:hypothetical protein